MSLQIGKVWSNFEKATDANEIFTPLPARKKAKKDGSSERQFHRNPESVLPCEISLSRNEKLKKEGQGRKLAEESKKEGTRSRAAVAFEK